jgi:hypothetical protein
MKTVGLSAKGAKVRVYGLALKARNKKVSTEKSSDVLRQYHFALSALRTFN